MRKLLAVFAFVTSASALLSAAAPAGAVTIGQAAVPAFSCSPLNPPSPGVRWQHATAATSPSYAVPPGGGVITSWSTNPGNNSGTSTSLEVVRESNGTVVGESAQEANLPRNQVTTFPTRVPVQAGDLIGLELRPSFAVYCGYSGVTGDETRQADDQGPGNALGGSTATFCCYLMDVSAAVEPDADGDAFGDESQDRCLGTAGQFNGCSKAVTLGKIKAKGTTLKVTATVPGPGTLIAGSANDPTLAVAAAKTKPLLKAVTKTLSSNSTQQVALILKLTKSAKQTLSQNGKLTLKVKAVFTPTGGPSGSQTKKTKLQKR